MNPDEAGQVDVLARRAVKEAMRGRGDPSEPLGFEITNFERHADGYLHARVTPDGGRPLYVHNQYGSWLAPGAHKGKAVLKEVMPHVAVELAAEARALRKREQKSEQL